MHLFIHLELVSVPILASKMCRKSLHLKQNILMSRKNGLLMTFCLFYLKWDGYYNIHNQSCAYCTSSQQSGNAW